MNLVESYCVKVWIAGDIAEARRSLRQQCLEEGLCVTMTATTFIYTAGAEEGVMIGFANYPRFPKTPAEIWERAVKVALRLRDDLCQRSVLVEASDKTEWFPREG